MTTYKLSEHDRCLAESATYQLKHEPKVTLTCESDFGLSEREYSLVNTMAGTVYADRITGTLFNRHTGACLTSGKIKLHLEKT